MSVVNIEGGRISGIESLELDGNGALVPNILKGPVRHVTETLKGSTSAFPSTYEYGEVWELRYSNAFTASQFQGIFLRVSNTVANTSETRGCEFDARNASGLNSGGLTGVYGSASIKGAGTITSAYGISGNVSVDSDQAPTITEMAAVRGKVQVEDAATYTAGYCMLAEHEAVTGGKAILAAYGAKSGGAAAFTSLIDATNAQLVETDSGTRVVLIKFQGANGTTYYMVHDTDAATVIAVRTSL